MATPVPAEALLGFQEQVTVASFPARCENHDVPAIVVVTMLIDHTPHRLCLRCLASLTIELQVDELKGSK